MTSPHALRYVGNGSARIPGVARRDLTRDDISRIGPVLIASAVASGLYEPVSKADAEKINKAAAATATTDPTTGEGDGAPGSDTTAGKDS